MRVTEEEFTDEQIKKLEREFKRITLDQQWCDQSYAEKTWDQTRLLRTENRRAFYRKVMVMAKLSRSQPGRARLLFHEIAGFVNDRGQMERVLDDQELAARRKFAEEESGKTYVDQEL